MNNTAPTRAVDDFTATGEAAIEAAHDVMQWDVPWVIKAPIALLVGFVTFVVMLGAALMGLALALIAVGFAAHSIFSTGRSGFDLLNQAVDFAQQNLSGWQLLSALGALAVGFIAFGFKGKKALSWAAFIYDWFRWHTGSATEPPEIAALKRSAAALGYRLTKIG